MLLIKNGRVLTMEGTTLPQGCVLIKGGKIKRVAPTIDETNLPRDHIQMCIRDRDRTDQSCCKPFVSLLQ